MAALRADLRVRNLLEAVIYGLGFWAPWERYTGLSLGGSTVWTAVPAALFRNHLVGFSEGARLLLILATTAAVLGALLRCWGVAAPAQRSSAPSTAPWSAMRDRLRIAGVFCQALALAVLMPPTGALAALALILVFEFYFVRLAPQRSLSGPQFHQATNAVASGPAIRWMRAALACIFPIATALGFLTQGTTYNGTFILRWVIVGFGLQLVTDAIWPPPRTDQPA